MGRPPRCRFVDQLPATTYFKPRGIPMSQLSEVALAVDELEAIRLADLDGLYQEQAAQKMNVSRQTFGRIIASARRKVAEALVKGMALKIDGGDFETPSLRTFKCEDCGHLWRLPLGTGRPEECPQCHGENYYGSDGGGCQGFGRGFGRRGGGGRKPSQETAAADGDGRGFPQESALEEQEGGN